MPNRGLLLFAALPLTALAQDAPSFAKDVAPIFGNSCIGCHASEAKMGGLDLSTFEGLQKGGHKGLVIAPGKSGESRLYQMIAGEAKPVMPMGGKLPTGDIETIKRWIDAGAKGPAPGEVIVSSRPKAPEIKPRITVKPQIFSLAYSPDGKTLAVGGYHE